ncbi:hypothetical protein IIA16_02845 [bacterium]|nr:hypothetical protein [bacterium]
MDLALYAKSREAFATEYMREHTAHYTGRKPTLEIAAIYSRHEALFTLETALDVVAATHDGNREEESLRRLAVSGYVSRMLAPLDEALAAAESEATVSHGGERIPYRQAFVRVSQEADRGSRRRLSESIRIEVERENPRRLQALAAEAEYLARMPLPKGYTEAWRTLTGVDYQSLLEVLEPAAEALREPYFSRISALLSRHLGVEMSVAEGHDLAALNRAPWLDGHFPEERLLPTLEGFLAGLGIDPGSQPHITYDLAPRPTKSPRAFCAPIRIPHEVVLSHLPAGGRGDLRTVLHEVGHAQHFGGTDASLPFALRWGLDRGTSEVWAFLLDSLMLDPLWLEEVAGLPAEAAALVAHFEQTNRMRMIRRYVAKLAYELRLHARFDEAEAAYLYATSLTEATGFPADKRDYLRDLDRAYYSADYLRAWFGEAQMRLSLATRFGPRWWASEVAGGSCLVKAAGGIATREQALAMVAAGADRLGTSNGAAILADSQPSPARGALP